MRVYVTCTNGYGTIEIGRRLSDATYVTDGENSDMEPRRSELRMVAPRRYRD